MYKNIDCLDKKYKPLILTWLADLFGYKDYPHSFKDQWIRWTVWDGVLDISFDLRQPEHVKLLSMIHPRFKGVPQRETLKVVNETSFYLTLGRLINIEYPSITDHKLLKSHRHVDNDGDTFYTYDWEVFLSDNTSIEYTNQSDVMSLKYRDFVFDAIIQQRAFTQFLDSVLKKGQTQERLDVVKVKEVQGV